MKSCAVMLFITAFFLAVLAHAEEPHKFWDARNKALFTGVAVARVSDVHSTWQFRSKNVNEILFSNQFVDNKAAFAAASAGMVGLHIGGCWLLHRTGHHKLERVASYVHVGVVGIGGIRNYTLRPNAHH